MLVSAFAQVAAQDASLQLVMAGPDETGWVAELKAQAEKLDISHRISWPGMLQGDAKWGAFYTAEALACGKPVLISNKVNIWREIESDAAGFVAEDTVAGTVQNLQRWLALDAPAYSQMAEGSRQCFLQRFHIQRAAERLLEIIREHSH